MELELIPAQTGNGTTKNIRIVKLICQLIADLQKGRTWNSKLIRSFMSFLYGGQSPTDKLILKLAYIFILSLLVWA